MKDVVHVHSSQTGLGSHSAVPVMLDHQCKSPTSRRHIGFCRLHDHGNSGSWRWLSTLDSVTLPAPWVSLSPRLAASQESQPFLL